jgi:hypothetical protein
MAITTLSSPLASVANKIVSVNSRSGNSLIRVQSEYKKFGDFLDYKTQELERTQLPDNKKIQKLANINVVNTFGSAGGLLGGLLGGALDVGGLVRGFFPGEGKKVGAAPQVGKPKTKPVIKNGKLRLGGIRALGVTNALFAGLDFTTGLAEGESIGKSAAGTSGALAGSLLGGAIGQALIPIPGVGFVIGSAAGSFLGGYGADRTYEAVESQRVIKAKQEAKLREQSQAVERSKPGKVENQNNILDKFDDVANKFEGFVKGIVGGVAGLFGMGDAERETPYGPGSTTTENDAAPPNTPEDTQNYSGGGKIVQYFHGEKGRAGYRADHWNHDHFSFTSRESAVTAFKALQSAGYKPYEFEGYGYVGGHSDTGGHYGPVGGPKTPNNTSDGTAFDIPYSSYGSGPIGPKDYEKSRRAHQIVLQALSRADESKPRGQANSSGAVNIELHASQPGGGTGLIGSYIDKPNAVTSSLTGAYGSYDRNFRGGDLGGPKRGLNLLEAVSFDKKNTDLMMNPKTRQAFVETQAQKLLGALPKNSNTPINIFAGHNDVTTGETGTAGTSNSSINGRTVEQVFTDMLGKRVEQLAKAAGMSNVNYIRSIIANDDKNPNTNWARSSRMRTSTVTPQSQVTTPPPKDRKVDTQLSYNQRQSRTLILDRQSAVIAAGGGASRPTSVPASSGGGGTVVVAASPYQAERNTLNKLQLLALV